MMRTKQMQAAILPGDQHHGGAIGYRLGKRIWENLPDPAPTTITTPGSTGIFFDYSTAPYKVVTVKRGNSTTYIAKRRSDGAYQVEGRNWVAIFHPNEAGYAARDLGPVEWAYYGGIRRNLPDKEFLDALIADLRSAAIEAELAC